MSNLPSDYYAKISQLEERISELESQLDEVRLHNHVLLDIARSLNASLDVQIIAQNIISAIASLIAIDKASVCLYEERKNDFSFIGIFDSSTLQPELPENLDINFLQSVLISGKTHYQSPAKEGLNQQWVCILPLLNSQRRIGTINIHAIRHSEITKEQIEFLETVAGHASAALENALLYALVEKESITDGLTGIYNHRYFKKRLREEISLCQRGKRQTALGLLMIDIDYFKLFNDTYGHQFGDKVLIEVVQSLNYHLREEDLLARYGGEEFVLLIPHASEKIIVSVSEKVRRIVENTRVHHRETDSYVHITVSVGATLWIPPDNAETIVQRADDALYQAKSKGRNQIALSLAF